ncbi:UNVERIFIED_CONTAM: hypothetical protein Slati_0492200 [Sesamum latifolium]|uniref:Uncharacterized protein n=1 Tax=Sesamum latifolium TaxID=2727402 RepID=A0AAW2XXB4_9LAMI
MDAPEKEDEGDIPVPPLPADMRQGFPGWSLKRFLQNDLPALSAFRKVFRMFITRLEEPLKMNDKASPSPKQ